MRKKRLKTHQYKKQNWFRRLLGIVGVAVVAFFLFSANKPCGNSITCLGDLSGRITPDTSGMFMGKNVPIPQKLLAEGSISPSVLGDQSGAQKHIYIDLTGQRLYSYEGPRQVYDFPISSGKWYPTPTGDFRIWIKLRATRMSGGNPAAGTYYNLPNVPYVQFFYNGEIDKSRGFSLHGTYWHNNFGHPMSHGCVNMRTEDAQVLYSWTMPQVAQATTYATTEEPGTPISIYGKAPIE